MRVRHLIGGESVDSADGATFDSVSPIDNAVLATVALGGATEVDRAVAAARRAFGPWSRPDTPAWTASRSPERPPPAAC